MLRLLLTIVLPLILPTALYLAWMRLVQSPYRDGTAQWSALPWLWLLAAGVLLLAAVLFVVSVGYGTREPGTYVPPRWVNGHIVPGHIEPRRSP